MFMEIVFHAEIYLKNNIGNTEKKKEIENVMNAFQDLVSTI